MPKFWVELSARVYFEGEIEAEDESRAIDYAWDEADEEVRWNEIDWDVDYVERIVEDEDPASPVDPNQEELF